MTERKTRVILFRGKSNSPNRDSEWVYGGFIPETKDTLPIIVESCDNDDDTLYVYGWTTVDPKTVGQYIGQTDKNGTSVFEGDIVKIKDFTHGCALNFKQPTSNWAVHWREDYARFCIDYMDIFPFDFTKSEVIGNIHDNPELLGGNHG